MTIAVPYNATQFPHSYTCDVKAEFLNNTWLQFCRLLKAVSAGLIQKWTEMDLPRPKWCDPHEDVASAFSFSDVVSVFALLVIGLTTSSIVFIVEKIVFCYSESNPKEEN